VLSPELGPAAEAARHCARMYAKLADAAVSAITRTSICFPNDRDGDHSCVGAEQIGAHERSDERAKMNARPRGACQTRNWCE
jgi:hypothetical protein